MQANLDQANQLLNQLQDLWLLPRAVNPQPLKVGLDLGTAYVVLVVTDLKNQPLACAVTESHFIKDGLVVDYFGAVKACQAVKAKVEADTSLKLENCAIAMPPGVNPADLRTHSNVAEAAGFSVTNVLDEPTAANAVLQIQNGAVVDIGGGTTGIAIFKAGQCIYTADEATGGHHMSLVLAGNQQLSLEDAEAKKLESSNHSWVYPIITPVVEKMASIVSRHIAGYPVEAIYLVGGPCCFNGIENTFAKLTGLPSFKPEHPLLVTPLGIALSMAIPD